MGNNQSHSSSRIPMQEPRSFPRGLDADAVIRLGRPPDFKKVLPERVPGQKLRLTTNGALLQTEGTISYRRTAVDPGTQLLQQLQDDAEPLTVPPDDPGVLSRLGPDHSFTPLTVKKLETNRLSGMDYGLLDHGRDDDRATSSHALTRDAGHKRRVPTRKRAVGSGQAVHSASHMRGDPSSPFTSSGVSPSPPRCREFTRDVSADVELSPQLDPGTSSPRKRIYRRNVDVKRCQVERAVENNADELAPYRRAFSVDRGTGAGGTGSSRQAKSVGKEINQRCRSQSLDVSGVNDLSHPERLNVNDDCRSSTKSDRQGSSNITDDVLQRVEQNTRLSAKKTAKAHCVTIGDNDVMLGVDVDVRSATVDIPDHLITINVSSSNAKAVARDLEKKNNLKNAHQAPATFYFGMQASKDTRQDLMPAATNPEKLPPVDVSSGSEKQINTLALARDEGPDQTCMVKRMERIPSHTLSEFVYNLECSRRRQLSLSREEILTNSSAAIDCTFNDSTYDMEVEAGPESTISMQLRPSVPRKQLRIPRFSPSAAWRGLDMDVCQQQRQHGDARALSPCLEDDDRPGACRPRPGLTIVDRKHGPRTPGSAEPPGSAGTGSKSADSGILADVSSPTCHRPEVVLHPPLASSSPMLASFRHHSGWVPAEDLESTNSGGSTPPDNLFNPSGARIGHSLPMLLSPAEVFSSRAWTQSNQSLAADQRDIEQHATNKFNVSSQGVSSVLRAFSIPTHHHQLDDNWALSRSMPSFNTDQRLSANQQNFMSLQSTDNHQTTDEINVDSVIVETDSGPAMSCPNAAIESTFVPSKYENSSLKQNLKKYSYQSTLRMREKKRLEAEVARLSEDKERKRLKEQRAQQQVEEEFQKKRLLMKSGLSNSMSRLTESFEQAKEQIQSKHSNIAERHSTGVGTHLATDEANNDSYFKKPTCESGAIVEHNPIDVINDGLPIRPQPTSCAINIVIPAPDYQSLQSAGMNGFDADLQGPVSLPACSRVQLKAKGDRTTLLSGVKNWLRGRREVGECPELETVRQDPDGAPSHHDCDPAMDSQCAGRTLRSDVHNVTSLSCASLSNTSEHHGHKDGDPRLNSVSQSPTSSTSLSTRRSSGYGSSPVQEPAKHRDASQRASVERKNRESVAERTSGRLRPSFSTSALYPAPAAEPALLETAGLYRRNERSRVALPPVFRHSRKVARIPDLRSSARNSSAYRYGNLGFQRSASQHELRARAVSRESGHRQLQPLARGRSEEQLTRVDLRSRHAPVLYPTPSRHCWQGYAPAMVNSSPARYMRSVDPYMTPMGYWSAATQHGRRLAPIRPF